jgi:GTP-binding protein
LQIHVQEACMRSELAYSAGSAREFPRDGLPEIALLGRSNVGKSSLLNALLGRRQLARTSRTPGRTRRIQFYRIDAAAYLVDLPGYGYARVPRGEREAWRGLVESYLRGARTSLRGALLLVDVRRELGDEEQGLLAWLEAEGIATELALVKADTLGRGKAQTRARVLAGTALPAVVGVVPVSARLGWGLGDLAGWIDATLGVKLRTAQGKPLAKEPPSQS